MTRCQCYDQCCCDETVPAVAALVAVCRVVLDNSQAFSSAWEFDPFDFDTDGAVLAEQMRAAVEALS